MNAKKQTRGLGRGLDALLGGSKAVAADKTSSDKAAQASPEVPRTLPVTDLQPGKYQPRTRMDEASLNELASSIAAQGLVQPIIVRPLGPGAKTPYEIIAGERRWRASQIAGLREVPVHVHHIADEAALAMALIENIQREDLNPLEEAQGLRRLIDEFQLTHQEAAEAVGRSRSAASNLLRLLELGDEVYGATLQLQPAQPGETWRVRVQYETSLGLSAEGPHLDLTGWEHCVSGWEAAEAVDAVSFVLPTPAAEQHACFPPYTQAELEQAVRAHAAAQGDPSQADDWIPRIGQDDALGTVLPFVAISTVRVRVEVLRKGRWVVVSTVSFLPPMGC